MKKTVSVERTLMLSISLTGDKQRDEIALRTLNFGVPVMSLQIRDMVEKDHDPFIFYNGPMGVFSHSLKDGELSIWEEKFTVEDR